MQEQKVKLTNLCPIFVSNDVKRTVNYYVEELGFQYAKHYDKSMSFATVYRDSIEFIIVQSKYGEVKSNLERYGSGCDAYINTDTVEGVDIMYEEFKLRNINIVSEPKVMDYSCYEFIIQDIDGRYIGIGLICDKQNYFKNANVL